MALIDVGYGADGEPTGNMPGGWTSIDLTNPANTSGFLTSVEVFFSLDETGVKVGTFSGSGTDYTVRDYATIGNVSGGSKQTIKGLSIRVVVGDFIGYIATGDYAAQTSEASHTTGYYAGDAFTGGTKTYTMNTAQHFSIYGTGYSNQTNLIF